MVTQAIQKAYKAHRYAYSEQYQRGLRKKSDNPMLRAPALLAAMEHLGEDKLSLEEARRRARRAVVEQKAADFVNGLNWNELKAFLGTIALFLKAGPWKEEEGMNSFQDQNQKRLTPDKLGERALAISKKLLETHNQNNSNKLKRLSAQVTAAGDKWTVLATLARFYPLRGVPGPVINDLVKQLEELHLDTFQELVAKALLFYEAQCKGWRPAQ
jgi:hypothetical protein